MKVTNEWNTWSSNIAHKIKERTTKNVSGNNVFSLETCDNEHTSTSQPVQT